MAVVAVAVVIAVTIVVEVDAAVSISYRYCCRYHCCYLQLSGPSLPTEERRPSSHELEANPVAMRRSSKAGSSASGGSVKDLSEEEKVALWMPRGLTTAEKKGSRSSSVASADGGGPLIGWVCKLVLPIGSSAASSPSTSSLFLQIKQSAEGRVPVAPQASAIILAGPVHAAVQVVHADQGAHADDDKAAREAGQRKEGGAPGPARSDRQGAGGVATDDEEDWRL